MNNKPVQSQNYPSVGHWCWRSRSGLLTLLAGAVILVLSAALGYRDHPEPDSMPWVELAIYLCAVIVVATQGLRLIRRLASGPGHPAQWLRSRFGKDNELLPR